MGGFGPLTYALVGSATGTYGTIHVNANGSYVYTLRSPYTNPTANDGVQTISGLESFIYSVTDSLGNTVQGTITIDVIDDVPVAVDDGILATTEEKVTGLTSGRLRTLTGDDTFGADGQGSAGESRLRLATRAARCRSSPAT